MRPMTLAEGSSGKVEMTKRVCELRKAYFRAVPEICIERARLVTEYSLKNGYFAKERLSILDKAKLYRYVLENRQAVVHHSRGYERDEMGLKLFKFTDTQLFAGSTTSKFKGVPLYPEFMALALWPELWTLPKRRSNPYQITEKEIEKLNWDIFPHWIDHTLLEHARKRHCDEPEFREAMKLFMQIVFFLTGKVENISHTIPDFSVALGKGLRGDNQGGTVEKGRNPGPAEKRIL